MRSRPLELGVLTGVRSLELSLTPVPPNRTAAGAPGSLPWCLGWRLSPELGVAWFALFSSRLRKLRSCDNEGQYVRLKRVYRDIFCEHCGDRPQGALAVREKKKKFVVPCAVSLFSVAAWSTFWSAALGSNLSLLTYSLTHSLTHSLTPSLSLSLPGSGCADGRTMVRHPGYPAFVRMRTPYGHRFSMVALPELCLRT